jgi:hypothetical protein
MRKAPTESVERKYPKSKTGPVTLPITINRKPWNVPIQEMLDEDSWERRSLS